MHTFEVFSAERIVYNKLVLIIFLLVGILHEIRMNLFLKRKRYPIKTRISNKDFNNKSL